MRATTIRDRSSLEVVPDGTIISWLRIPGDYTSAAVAFVHREIEQELDADGRPTEHTGPIIWISPDGWEPMTIEDAGIRYPAEIIRWGEGMADPIEIPVPPEPEQLTLHGRIWPEYPSFDEIPPLTGGTWAREKALECAVQFWAPAFGAAHNLDRRRHTFLEITEGHVLATADVFEHWLDRDDETTVPPAVLPDNHEIQSTALSTDLCDIWNDLDPEPDLNSRWLAAELIKRGWKR